MQKRSFYVELCNWNKLTVFPSILKNWKKEEYPPP